MIFQTEFYDVFLLFYGNSVQIKITNDVFQSETKMEFVK